MKTKKCIALFLTIILALTLLAACGGGDGGSKEEASEATESVENTETSESTESTKALDSGEIVEIVFKDLGISMSQGSEIKVSAPDGEGHLTVTFKVGDKDCSYVLDAYTGEIISKDVPDGVVEAAQASGDPMEQAINAAFDSIEGYQGGAEDIKVKQSGTDIIVEFDWNGEHYTKTYDTNEGKIID